MWKEVQVCIATVGVRVRKARVRSRGEVISLFLYENQDVESENGVLHIVLYNQFQEFC
jgi:hypothetical protein